MRLFSEITKLLSVFCFFVSMAFKAFFKKDQEAKRFITGLYLYALSAKAQVPSKVVPVNSFESYKVSAHLYKDMNLPIHERFILMESADLLPLLALLYYCKPQKIFEFGLMKGGSLLHFFLNTEDNVTVDSIDINTNNLSPYMLELIAKNARIKIHHENSLQFDPEPYSGQVDFIFIDGGHDYEVVKNDTQKAMKMLSSQGTIVWDDYNPSFPGVFRYVNEFAKQHDGVFHVKGSKLACWQRL